VGADDEDGKNNARGGKRISFFYRIRKRGDRFFVASRKETKKVEKGNCTLGVIRLLRTEGVI